MNSRDAYWRHPVEIVMHSGLQRMFRHPYDALDFLQAEWPTRKGKAYRRALLWCAEALKMQDVAGLARRAFITAAREAGLLLRERQDAHKMLPAPLRA